MICGGENGTNGCRLAGFSEDVDFARHFIATCLPPTLPPYRRATGIGYASRNYVSTMVGKEIMVVGNSASYSPNSWWIDRP